MMKKGTFWKVLAGVVVAVLVLGALGFGLLANRMWGGRFSIARGTPFAGRMLSGEYDGEMPCDEYGEGEEEPCDYMAYGQFFGRGMGRMPHMRGMPGMYGGWGYRGSSLLTWLLILAVIVLSVLYFRQRKTIDNVVHNSHTRSGVVADAEVVSSDNE
ncbi:MAG: hypothetical protein P1S60_05255 [Anaerolineae bacterium]|nr:hypothetical protein [Anaerolineae bacterium]